jgi:hypothetical protein
MPLDAWLKDMPPVTFNLRCFYYTTLLDVILRASSIDALKFSAVKVIYSALNPDTARGADASFTRGSILRCNQEAKNSP